MKIQIISDIHLEFKYKLPWDRYLIPAADILILAGDICYLKDYFTSSIVDEFFSYLEDNWEQIIYVPGNHEFYQMQYNESFRGPNYIDPENELIISDNAFRHINYEHHKVTIVNNDVIEIDGINFVCSTLWSQIPPQYEQTVRTYLADFRFIGKMTPSNFNYLNKEAVTFVRNSIDKLDNVVVVSHHLPSYQVVSKQYASDPVTYGFANSHLDNLLDPDKIKLWIHGHSHDHVDKMVNDVRVIRNPFGYMSEQKNGYINDKVIEI